MKLKVLVAGFLILACGLTSLKAQETGHYVPGITGIKGGSLPPAGFYYIMHNVAYSSSSNFDGLGNELDINFDLNVFVNAHRLVYVVGDAFLGANYATNLIVPLINTDISIGAFGIDDKQFGLGDIIFDPLILSWNKDRYDVAFGLGAVMPTGSYDITRPSSPGKSFWTGLLTLGGTYYFDAHKSWHASILSRYEVHSKKKDFDVTAGNDFTFEWGLGKTIPAKQIWNVGVSGYAHWQLTEDKGADVLYDASIKDKVFAVGPEVGCFIPPLKLNIELRGQYEFGAVDRSQGPKACLTLIKIL